MCHAAAIDTCEEMREQAEGIRPSPGIPRVAIAAAAIALAGVVAMLSARAVSAGVGVSPAASSAPFGSVENPITAIKCAGPDCNERGNDAPEMAEVLRRMREASPEGCVFGGGSPYFHDGLDASSQSGWKVTWGCEDIGPGQRNDMVIALEAMGLTIVNLPAEWRALASSASNRGGMLPLDIDTVGQFGPLSFLSLYRSIREQCGSTTLPDGSERIEWLHRDAKWIPEKDEHGKYLNIECVDPAQSNLPVSDLVLKDAKQEHLQGQIYPVP